MSTLKVSTLQNASSATANITLDTNGNATVGNTLAMGSSFLRNRLINGDMQFDQRNAGASTAVADDVYCFDRWYVLTQTASVNVSQQTNQEDGTPFNIRLTQNQASAQRMGLAQIIESVNCVDLRGRAVTLNMRLRSSSSQAIRYAILEWTGTADSVTSDVVNSWTNTTYTAGQFFISTTTTVTAVGSITPSANTWTPLSVPLTGTLGSSFNNITVFVWTEGTAAQNVTLDISRVQLEVGSVATPFERRQYGTELMLCQRYYQTGRTYFEQPVTSGSDYAAIYCLGVDMRAAPTTIAASSAAAFNFPTTSAVGAVGTRAVFDRRRANGSGAGYFETNLTMSAEL